MRHFYTFIIACSALAVFLLCGFTSNTIGKQDKLLPPFLGDLVNLDTVNIHLTDCGGEGKLCLPINLGQALQWQITDNGNPIAVDIMNGCDFDTTSAYTYSTLFGQGNFGPYHLTSWPIGGQVFMDTFNTIPELVDSMNAWDPMGNWQLDAAHLLITGGNPAVQYDTMKVWVIAIQTPSFIGYNFGVTPNGTEMTFDKGFHEVIITDTLNNMTDTFYVHVSCSESVDVGIVRDTSGIFCPEFDDLLTGIADLSICSPNGPTTTFSLTNGDSCVSYLGSSMGLSTTCLVGCDSLGFCDTIWLNCTVFGTGQMFVHHDEIGVGEESALCLDTLNLNGPIEMISFCYLDLSSYANFALNPTTNCIQYIGLQTGGTDTVCVAACDAFGICDTTFLSVRVRRYEPIWTYDTVYLNQNANFCVDLLNSLGSPQALEVFDYPDPLFLFYNIDQTSKCAGYTGMKVGTDTLGVRLRDDLNTYDSTYIVVTTIMPTTQIVFDTLSAAEQVVFCLDTSELGGTNFTIQNICENSSNDDVSFDINDLTLCLEMQALSPGTDTACITLCDNLGVCDTIIFYITALDEVVVPTPPVANPDNGISVEGASVILSILDNDNINPAFTDIFVLPPFGTFGPLNGEVLLDAQTGTVVYSPDEGFCDNTDNFLYVVCNQYGCDTAIVTVMVTCPADTTDNNFKVYNGFSPNGDNTNDHFVIKNADKFPGHELFIFNRWGNQILYRVNYENDWDGTWNGSPLPDGVYFYVFDTKKGEILKNIIVIQR